MPDKNNNHNGSCEFSPEIVAYLYGEIDGPQRDIFDEHLAGCDACTAELAGVSVARLSVMEWRAAEFDTLPTPSVAIPYGHAEREISIGWLAALRGFFTASPGWAATAAVVPISILCLGLVLYTFDLFDPVDMARQENSVATESMANRSSLQNSNEAMSNKSVQVTTSNDKINKELTDLTAAPKVADTPPATPKAVKVSDESVRPQKSVGTSSGDPGVKMPKRSESPAPRQKAPRLNNFEDEEDESLRLTDLFAQTDTED